MFQLLLAGVLLISLTWIYFKWSRAKHYWAKRGVPHEPFHPILGSLTFIHKKNPSLWMIDVYRRFKGAPYVGLWWFWRPVLLINSPEIVKNILIKDSASFRDRFTRSNTSDPVGSLNLFTIKDPDWTPIRRHMTSLFTSSKLKLIQSVFDLKSSELVSRIKTANDSSKLSLKTLFTDYTTDIIGTTAFGVKTNATLTGEDPIRDVTRDIMKVDALRGVVWTCAFFLPELTDFFRFQLFPKACTDLFRKILQIVLKQRQQEDRDPASRKDVLDALLTLKDTKDLNSTASLEDIVVAQATTFLLGGFETSGTALTFIVYELAFECKMQDKLYDELIKAKNSSEDGTLDMTTLSELNYLDATIKEGLRKYSPMGWLDRIASKDYKVDDKLTIPAGTPVYLNAIGMQFDEDNFPNPEKYDPERFMPENEKNIKPYMYLPFGEGPRACVGKRFGLNTVRQGLASLALNFKFEPVPGAPKPNDVELEKYGVVMTPAYDIFVKFVPRN